MHRWGADVAVFDIPWGSGPPHLPVGVFELLQIQSVRRGEGPVAINLFCSLILSYMLLRLLLCEVNENFPPVFTCKSIWQTTFISMYGEIIGANRAGKVDCTVVSP